MVPRVPLLVSWRYAGPMPFFRQMRTVATPTPYAGWRHVEGGPEQAATWRANTQWSFWKGALPNLIFPADRSWLVSTRWGDDWTGVGGPAGLIAAFLRHPDLLARSAVPGEDATPPGHQAL
jgi:hypothetical protein